MTNFLYHVANQSDLKSIASEGLRKGTYFGCIQELAIYYSEVLSDEGITPIVLLLDLDKLDASKLEPDFHGLEEPIMSVVRGHSGHMNEDDLYEAWIDTDQSWQSCLGVIGSVRYQGIVPPEELLVINLDTGKTIDFLKRMRPSIAKDIGMKL